MAFIDPLEPELSEDGRIIDYITGDLLEDKPEEWVRQRLQRMLHVQHGYPKNRIAREVPNYCCPVPKAKDNYQICDTTDWRKV